MGGGARAYRSKTRSILQEHRDTTRRQLPRARPWRPSSAQKSSAGTCFSAKRRFSSAAATSSCRALSLSRTSCSTAWRAVTTAPNAHQGAGTARLAHPSFTVTTTRCPLRPQHSDASNHAQRRQKSQPTVSGLPGATTNLNFEKGRATKTRSVQVCHTHLARQRLSLDWRSASACAAHLQSATRHKAQTALSGHVKRTPDADIAVWHETANAAHSSVTHIWEYHADLLFCSFLCSEGIPKAIELCFGHLEGDHAR